MLVGMCPLSNQLIPLPLNDDTDVISGNGVSASESEVLEVSVMSGVTFKERLVWLKIRRKKHHKPPFLSAKKPEKNPTAGFSIYICSTPNQNNITPSRNDRFQVMGNTPVAVAI